MSTIIESITSDYIPALNLQSAESAQSKESSIDSGSISNAANENASSHLDAQVEPLVNTIKSTAISTSNISKSSHTNSSNAKTEEILLQEALAERDYFRHKAIQQDVEIFEMRALLQSGKGLSNILNLRPLLDTFMAVVREKYSATNTAVLLKDDLENAEDYYRVKAFYGLEDRFIHPSGLEESLHMFKFPKDNGLLWQLIQQGNVFSVRDMQHGPRFKNAWKKWNLDVLKSDVWCPLIKSGEVLGILTVGPRDDGSQIAESEYPFIQELASIAITNIDSTLKYEKNERILKNIQTLYDINQQIANVNDFKKLCIETLSKAVDVLMTQKGNLMIYNKITKKLEIRVVWGNIPKNVRDEINNGLVETKTFEIGEGVAGLCAKTKKPIRVNDRTQIPQVGQHAVYCIASVPILYGNELEGVINMTNKVILDDQGNKVLDPLGRFTEEDIGLLLGLADQAAVNLNKTRIYSQSITDRMTGLYNTRYFEQMLFEKFTESVTSGQPLTIAISDIDHFKKFNDSNGHAAGDEVLKHVARLFSECARPDSDDMAFRYGGEEFCMLMPNTTPDEAMELIEKYRARLEATPLEHMGATLRVQASVGLATSILDATDIKRFFESADEALYACKHNGRNQIRHYSNGAKIRYQPAGLAELIQQAYK